MGARPGQEFAEYDPKSRYVAIRAKGLDYNPNFYRIRFEQAGRTVTLAFADLSLAAPETLVVRVPAKIGPGPVTVSIENRGGDAFSVPVVRTFELPARK